MRSANIAELKNKLSTYLNYVKAGETIVVRDRNLPVAKLVPFVAGDATDDDLALVAAGVMRMPPEAGGLEELWSMPWPEASGDAVMAALLEERHGEDAR
jgi:prevent-host-death family protein